MEKKWKIVITNFLIFIILSIILFFYFSSKNSLKKIVEDNRKDWDLLSLQNTLEDGEYMGKIYEKSYVSTSFSKDFMTVLAINYYMNRDGNFYEDENMIDFDTFKKTVSIQEFNEIVKQMLGPDVPLEIEDIEYGCGVSLKKNGNNYIITSSIPDVCGVSTAHDEFYISHISSYYKKNSDIIINFKVGYIKLNTVSDEYGSEDVTYELYTDKSKQSIIQKDYDADCVNTDGEKKCYENLLDYEVILKKASDGKYFFYQINKL